MRNPLSVTPISLLLTCLLVANGACCHTPPTNNLPHPILSPAPISRGLLRRGVFAIKSIFSQLGDALLRQACDFLVRGDTPYRIFEGKLNKGLLCGVLSQCIDCLEVCYGLLSV